MLVLNTHRLLSTNSNNQEKLPELVLLHGWGMSSVVWKNWIPLLQPYGHITTIDLPGYGGSAHQGAYNLDELLEKYIAVIPDDAVLIGYSLGGMLAIRLGNAFPKKIASVITISTNMKFVADKSWSLGMPSDLYENFFHLVTTFPNRSLKTFFGLQIKGAKDERALLKNLKRIDDANIDGEVLNSSLSLLASIDNRYFYKIDCPVLCIFGEHDNLVSVEIVDDMLMEKSNVEVKLFKSAPHAIFLSDAELLKRTVINFLYEKNLLIDQEKLFLDKRQVAKSFSRAANTYDDVADLQRRVGNALLEKLPSSRIKDILDLGCGTGYFTKVLGSKYNGANVLGLDLAEGMVRHASFCRDSSLIWLCGDAEDIPLQSSSIDLVFSSLAIQWCQDNKALFSEIFRTLKPGGYFVFSTLGPNTLYELKQSWQSVDDYVHVNRFHHQPILLSAAKSAGFILEEFKEVFEVLEYSRLRDLTRELKHLGAHNVNSGRPAGLTGKKRIQQFTSAYELQRNDKGLLPATYQVWYGVMAKPAN